MSVHDIDPRGKYSQNLFLRRFKDPKLEKEFVPFYISTYKLPVVAVFVFLFEICVGFAVEFLTWSILLEIEIVERSLIVLFDFILTVLIFIPLFSCVKKSLTSFQLSIFIEKCMVMIYVVVLALTALKAFQGYAYVDGFCTGTVMHIVMVAIVPAPRFYYFIFVTISITCTTAFVISVLYALEMAQMSQLRGILNSFVTVVLCSFISTTNILFFEDTVRRKFISTKITSDSKSLLERERLENEKLLLNIFPKHLIEPIKDMMLYGKGRSSHKSGGRGFIVDEKEETCILQSDIVDFTHFSSNHTAEVIVSHLDEHFTHFDSLCEQYCIEKIKTAGDEFVCAKWRDGNDNRVFISNVLDMALDMQAFLEERGVFQMRIGISFGKAILFVIGDALLSFDIIGRARTVSTILETTALCSSSGEEEEGGEKKRNRGLIICQEEIFARLNEFYDFELHGSKVRLPVHIFLRGSGEVKVYRLLSKKTLPREKSLEHVDLYQKKSKKNAKSSSSSDNNNEEEEEYNFPPVVQKRGLRSKILTNLNEIMSIQRSPKLEYQFHKRMFDEVYVKAQRHIVVTLSCAVVQLYFVSQYILEGYYFIIPQYAMFAFTLVVFVISLFVRSHLLAVVVQLTAFSVTFFFNIPVYFQNNDTFIYNNYVTGMVSLQIFTIYLGVGYPFFIKTIPLFVSFAYPVIEAILFDKLDYLCFLYYACSVCIGSIFAWFGEFTEKKYYVVLERVRKEKVEIDVFNRRNVVLIRSVIPMSVQEKLKAEGYRGYSENHSNASVLFIKLKRFEKLLCEFEDSHSIVLDLVGFLDQLFQRFDDLLTDYRVNKIKSAGNTYIAVTGISKMEKEETEEGGGDCYCHVSRICNFALKSMEECMKVIEKISSNENSQVSASFSKSASKICIQIGISEGDISAGILGKTKFLYDIFGRVVNFSARLCQTAEENSVQVSTSVFEKVQGMGKFEIECLGEKNLKGIGCEMTYKLKGNGQVHYPAHSNVASRSVK